MTTSPTSAWSDRYLLGYAPMDHTHEEFVELADALLRAGDSEIGAALAAFERHAVDHFAQEKAWMGDDFPARDCHIQEHDNVLASVHEVQALVEAGNVEVARRLAASLLDWFAGHADFMDSALALWMVKRRHGGAPVVLKRAMAAGAD